MKRLFTLILILGALFLGYKGVKKIIDSQQQKAYIKEVKKGWYVEIVSDYLRVRSLPNRTTGDEIGRVYAGEVYKVLEVDLKDSSHYWFKIEYNHGTGWVAQDLSGTLLIDHNDPTDIATPSVKYSENEYHVISIDDINYKHLIIWDDRDDYTVTHQIYHEVDPVKEIDQYWIKYTVTDASGKHSSKTQKIIFEIPPEEDEVLPFSEHTYN